MASCVWKHIDHGAASPGQSQTCHAACFEKAHLERSGSAAAATLESSRGAAPCQQTVLLSDCARAARHRRGSRSLMAGHVPVPPSQPWAPCS